MPRQGLTPDRVVAEAAVLADEAGLEAVTFAALADRLGVRAPSLYKHVDGVEGLRARLAVRSVGELADVLTTAVAGRSGAEALRAAGVAYVGWARAHPGRYPLTVRAPAPGDVEHGAAADRAVDMLRATLRSAALPPEAELHAIRTLRSALHGFAALDAAGGFGLDLDRDASLAFLLDVLGAGLGAG